MSEKHTPGPWRLAEVVENKFSKTDMRRIRSVDEGMEHGAVCEVYGVRDSSTAAANARLIAAAPELLEALQELVTLVDDFLAGEYTPDSFTTQPACAAIAKATGATHD